MLAEALRPLATNGTAMVCFASMAPLLGNLQPDPAVAAILDAPLDERFLDWLHDALGSAIENTGAACAWAKHGVHRFVQREAVRLGRAGPGSAPSLPASSTRPRASRKRRAIRRWTGSCSRRRSAARASPTKSAPSSAFCCQPKPASSPELTSLSTAASAPPSAAKTATSR
jgi:hypothetical protein